MKNQLIVSYRGPLPSRGEAPAFATFESMLAFSQASIAVLHFANTGTVRRRKFAQLDVDLRISGTREGSFEFILEYWNSAPAIAQFLGSAAAGGAAWDFMKGTFGRVLGGKGSQTTKKLEESEQFNAGDLEALIQAIEPAIKRAHSPIGSSATKILISVEGQPETIEFNPNTKAFLLDNLVNDEVRSKRFQVTSFDGRARTGRLFDMEEKFAVTFELTENADFKSLRAIVNAARAFALRVQGQFSEELEVVGRFRSLDASDGRVKKVLLDKVRGDYDEL